MIAYLMKKQDYRMSKALARILVIPYFVSGSYSQNIVDDYFSNPQDYMLYTSTHMYKTSGQSHDKNFIQTVKNFLFNTHNKRFLERENQTFYFDDDLYYDDGQPYNLTPMDDSIIPTGYDIYTKQYIEKMNTRNISKNKFLTMIKTIDDQQRINLVINKIIQQNGDNIVQYLGQKLI